MTLSRLWVTVLVAGSLCGAAQAADEVGLAHPGIPKAPTFRTVLTDTLQMLEAPLQASGLRVATPEFPGAVAGNSEKARERIAGLLLNALHHAPRGGEVQFLWDPAERRLTAWIPNPSTPFSTLREVTDPNGNVFEVQTMEGQGSSLSTRL